MASTNVRQSTTLADPRWSDEVGAALNGIYTIWRRDLVRFYRERTRLLASLAQPAFFLLILGGGLSAAMGRLGDAQAGVSYTQFLFPGIIGMAVLFASMFSSISVVWDREFGFLKEVLVAPVPRWAVVVGKALGGSTTAMIQGGLMLLFAPLAGVALTPLTVLALVPVMFVIAFGLSSFGLAIATRIRTMEGFQVVMNFVMMPMFFLSGALFPLVNLPGWLTVLTHVNPVSYGVDALRQITFAQGGVPPEVLDALTISMFGRTPTVMEDLAFLALFAALMIALAVRSFSAQE